MSKFNEYLDEFKTEKQHITKSGRLSKNEKMTCSLSCGKTLSYRSTQRYKNNSGNEPVSIALRV